MSKKLLAAFASIAVAAAVIAASSSASATPKTDPFTFAPDLPKNCSPSSCTLVCVKNDAGQLQGGNFWHWVHNGQAEGQWPGLLVKWPQSYAWDSTLLHNRCAYASIELPFVAIH